MECEHAIEILFVLRSLIHLRARHTSLSKGSQRANYPRSHAPWQPSPAAHAPNSPSPPPRDQSARDHATFSSAELRILSPRILPAVRGHAAPGSP